MATIPECLAFEFCRALKSSCDVCLELDLQAWKKHVKKVLRKAEKT